MVPVSMSLSTLDPDFKSRVVELDGAPSPVSGGRCLIPYGK